MAAPPLFDIAGIDLGQVAVPPGVVADMNPQAGPMRQLDHVIWKSEDSRRGIGVKHVRHDEFWVPYHIPGRPLMPGVMMIEAAAQLCSVLQRMAHATYADQFIGFTRCEKVAFRGQVVPGDTLYLLAIEISHRRRRFVSSTQGFVNDQLVFEAEITGMAF